MLFKFTSEKVDQKLPPLGDSHPVVAIIDSKLTAIDTHMPNAPTGGANQRYTAANNPSIQTKLHYIKWRPLLLISAVIIASMAVFIVYYSMGYLGYFQTSCTARGVPDGRCYHKHQWGDCVNASVCCDGEYVIARHMCGGNSLCCLGAVTDKCKGRHRSDSKGVDSTVWSYRSLTRISSLIVCRNVREPVVEQAIVYTVSALQDREYYHQMSAKVGSDLTRATGQQWYAIVGAANSYDMYLKPFAAYILISIQELELMLFSTNVSDSYGADYDGPDYYGAPGGDDYPDVGHNVAVGPAHRMLDTGPSIAIIRNELNDTQREFTVRTIDFAFNVCANSYTCVTYKTVGALNQQYVAHNRADSMSGTDAGPDNQWQCIVTSNTATDQLVVGVDYMSSSLLDVIYGNRHRVVVFKVENVHRVQKSELTEWDVIRNARKCIQLNKTIIMDQNLMAPANHGRLNSRSLPFPAFKQPQSLTALAMKDIRRAVMTQTKYWSICQRLTHGGDIPGQLWWAECVAGAQHTFSRAVADNRYDKHYLIVKMDSLVIILFQKVPDAIVESKHIRAG